MATITAKTGSLNWDTEASWVGEVAPGSSDDAVIPDTSTITCTSMNITVNSVTVQNGGTWVINASTQVQCPIAIEEGGLLQVNGTSGTNGNATVAGTITYETSGYNNGVITVEDGGVVNFSNSTSNIGDLNVESGGLLTFNNSATNYSQTVIVDEGGECTFANSYNYGDNWVVNGDLMVSGSSFFYDGDIIIGPTGTMLFEGDSMYADVTIVVQNGGTLTVTHASNTPYFLGTLDIEAGGTVTFGSGNANAGCFARVAGTLTIDGSANYIGHVLVEDGGVVNSNSGGSPLYGALVRKGGEIVINGGNGGPYTSFVEGTMTFWNDNYNKQVALSGGVVQFFSGNNYGLVDGFAGASISVGDFNHAFDEVVSTDLPSAENVRVGVNYAGGVMSGTLALLAEQYVAAGQTYGGDGNEFTGTLTSPSMFDVRSGIQYGGGGDEFTGACAVPIEANVKFGIAVGEGTGTCRVPAQTDVRFGVNVGVTDQGTCHVPPAADVQQGVNVGVPPGAGTFVVPSEAQVEVGVGFGAAGAEFTGSLAAGGSGAGPQHIRFRR